MRAGLAVFAVLGGLMAGAASMAPASCEAPASGFLAPADGILPASAIGIPWVTYVLQFDPALGYARVPIAGDFHCFEIDGNGEHVREVLLDRLALPTEVSARPPALGALYLLRPADGLHAGSTYRFEYLHRFFAPPTPHEKERGVQVTGIDSATVRVTSQLLATPAGTMRLEVGPAVADTLEVAAHAPWRGRLTAVRRDIEMMLPSTWKPWRGALLYATEVDGATWRPGHDNCEPIPPGHSWVGPGRERLFHSCGWTAEYSHLSEEPLWSLSGTVHARMTAWLPGTGLAVTAEADVMLPDCDSAETGQP